MIFLSIFVYFSSSDLWLWAVAGVGAGAFLFYRGFRLLQRRRLILDTPASKIRSASMGLVEVSGLAVGPYTMQAPITGTPCYYYRTVAWQLRQSGKNKEWKKVADESLHLPFYLDDNTGRLLVNPQGAELEIHRDFHEEYDISFFSSTLNLPVNVAGFLARHGIGSDKKLRLDEYCIKPKNALFILGTLAANPGLEVKPTPVTTISDNSVQLKFTMNLPAIGNLSGGMLHPLPAMTNAIASPEPVNGENETAEIIRLRSAQPARLTDMTQQGRVAAALVRAGITNPTAWEAAGLQDSSIVMQTASVSGAGNGTSAPSPVNGEFDLHPPALLMKGSNNPAFFISWRSQHEVAQSLGWKSTLMIWGGPALLLLSLYFLLLHFGWW